MSDSPVNLLMIVPSLRMGGAERQAVDLANALSRDRFRVHVVTFEKEVELADRLDTERASLSRLARKSKFDLSAAAGIARMIREEHIDIVHCTLQIAYLYGWFGRRKSGRRPILICALHTTVNRNLKSELFDWFLYAPLLAFSDGIITVCRNQQAYWSSKFPWLRKKIRTVHNGIDLEKYRDEMDGPGKQLLRSSLGIAKDDFVMVMNAALRPEKGHVFALKAMHELVREGRKLKLILLGDGDERSGLEALSKSLGLEGSVLWLGWRSDPRPYLGIGDILLHPSWADTLPLSVLEALAMGKPVVATSVGGIPEIIADGLNGVIVPPKDAGAIGAAIVRIMTEPGLRDRLARNARDSVRHDFSIQEMARRSGDLLAAWSAQTRSPDRDRGLS